MLVSPVMESCPTENKEKAMSLLHSFYCWGHVAVVLISTVFFRIFGISNWKILAIVWAAVPLANLFLFAKAPIASLIKEGEQGLTLRELLSQKIFWVFLLMMVCAGASEQSVSQWASAFAEKALGVGKTVGDLAGPMAFAVLMGISRAFYGKYGDKIDLDRFMGGSAILCILSYLCISPDPNSGGRADRLRHMRLVRGNYVAWCVQPGLCNNSKRRHRNVCLSCACRRPWVLRRAHACRARFQSFRKQSARGNSGGDSFPCAFIAGNSHEQTAQKQKLTQI